MCSGQLRESKLKRTSSETRGGETMNMTGSLLLDISILLVTAAVCVGIGYFIRKWLAEAKIQSAELAAKQIVENAKKDAEAVKKEKLLEAKDEALKIRTETEEELKEWRLDIQQQERRLIQKEEALDRKMNALEQREESLNQ